MAVVVMVAVEPHVSAELYQFSRSAELHSDVVVSALLGLARERGFVGRPVRDAMGYIVGTTDEVGAFWIGRVGRPGTHDHGEVFWSHAAPGKEALPLAA